MPKWVYPLAFAFLLFVIFNDPGGAGALAHNFADLIGDILGAAGNFLTGLFGGSESDAAATTDTTLLNSNSAIPGQVADNLGNTVPLDHTHGTSNG